MVGSFRSRAARYGAALLFFLAAVPAIVSADLSTTATISGTTSIVHDEEEGTLNAYVMDGHASQPVRLPAKSLSLRIEAAGEEFTLELKPVADALTGETVGDTSRFEIRADLIKRIRSFSGAIVELEVFDRVFKDIAFTYAPQ